MEKLVAVDWPLLIPFLGKEEGKVWCSLLIGFLTVFLCGSLCPIYKLFSD